MPEPDGEIVGVGETDPVVEEVGVGELHTLFDVVVHVESSTPLPDSVPHVEQGIQDA